MVDGALALDAFGVSHTGPVRASNEDAFFVGVDLSLFVLADGMGGHAAGEVASHLAVDAIHEFVRRGVAGDPTLAWPCSSDASISAPGNLLRAGIHRAHRIVLAAAHAREAYAGMGTTVVCALVSGGQLSVGHVGDSRLYLHRGSILSLLTTDDTWAAIAIAAGGDARAIAEHPMRNVLTNVVGGREEVEVHLHERPIAAGDRLLLCSDGIHNVLDGDALAGWLCREMPAREMAAGIVRAALDSGTRDNATAIVVRCSPPGSGG